MTEVVGNFLNNKIMGSKNFFPHFYHFPPFWGLILRVSQAVLLFEKFVFQLFTLQSTWNHGQNMRAREKIFEPFWTEILHLYYGITHIYIYNILALNNYMLKSIIKGVVDLYNININRLSYFAFKYLYIINEIIFLEKIYDSTANFLLW